MAKYQELTAEQKNLIDLTILLDAQPLGKHNFYLAFLKPNNNDNPTITEKRNARASQIEFWESDEGRERIRTQLNNQHDGPIESHNLDYIHIEQEGATERVENEIKNAANVRRRGLRSLHLKALDSVTGGLLGKWTSAISDKPDETKIDGPAPANGR